MAADCGLLFMGTGEVTIRISVRGTIYCSTGCQRIRLREWEVYGRGYYFAAASCELGRSWRDLLGLDLTPQAASVSVRTDDDDGSTKMTIKAKRVTRPVPPQ